MTQARKNAQVDTNSEPPSLDGDTPLTEEQARHVIRAGEEASQLLGTPVYNIAYQNLLQEKHMEWLETEPKEERRRESLYHQCKGLIEITERMGTMVADARRLLEAQQAQQDPRAQRNEYLNNQGFGLN